MTRRARSPRCVAWLLLVAASCSKDAEHGSRGVSLLPLLVDGGVTTRFDPANPNVIDRGRKLFDEQPDRYSPDWIVHEGAEAVGLLGLAAPIAAATPPADSGTAGLRVPSSAACLRVVPILRNRTCRYEVAIDGDASAARVVLVQFADKHDAEQLRDVANLRDALLKHLVGTDVLTAAPDPSRPGRTVFSAAVEQRVTSRVAAVAILTGAAPVRVIEARVETRSLAYTVLSKSQPDAYPCRFVRRIDAGGNYRPAVILRTPASVEFPIAFDAREPVLEFALLSLDDHPIGLRATIAARSDSGVDERAVAIPAVGPARWTPIRVALPPLGDKTSLRVSIASDDGAEVCVAFASPFVAGADLSTDLDVVCVSLDTVRADRMSTLPSSATSPNFARLAAQSAVFESAIAAASFTLPSHVTILSGQYPDRHGVNGLTDAIDSARVPFLVSEFSRAGYRTHALTGGGYVHPDFGFAAGFLEYETRDLERDVSRVRAGDAAAFSDDTPVLSELRSILDQPRVAPLFLFVHTYAAHGYTASDEDLQAVGADVAAVRVLHDALVADKKLDALDEVGNDPKARETMRRFYDASVRSADRVLGAVVAELERSGRLERTLLIVLADHGEELYEHGKFGHGHSVNEEQLRVPLLVRGPGIVARVVKTPVSLVDVAPTLREFCGLPPRADEVDGRSLAAALRSNADPSFVPMLARSPTPKDGIMRALRGDRFKLVTGGADAAAWSRLYDLRTDPTENSDVAPQKAPDVARIGAAMREQVDRLRRAGAGAAKSALSAEAEAALKELGYLGGD